MAKKEPIYKGLAELSVEVDDRSLNSPDYFRIIKMPVEFTAGVNSIKFKGNTSLFVNESVVEIEVLDSNGSPIYHEIGLDLESEQQNAVINVYINQDTAPGIGSVIICGTISKDAQGKLLDSSKINLRWSAPISVDISKRNNVDILYDALPTVAISSTSAVYTNLGFPGGVRIVTQSVTVPAGHISYFNYNNEPLLATGSQATFAFTSSAISSNVTIASNNLSNVSPSLPSNLGTLIYTSSIKIYSGSGIAYLTAPIVFKNPNGIENYIVRSANVLSFTYEVEQSASLASAGTENSYNEAVAYFTNLTPQSGQVAKIRSYYKSTGVGEYIFSNETDITAIASEDGFTPSTFTASFAIPTTHRNDRLDFKFEFVNPSGLVSKQVVETKNHLFLGGNTYVGGDDNLLTGSLYVAGSTGTGVHISGKGSAAMIRSIGYNGFQRATTTGPGGFVMYSGSIQPLLNASESYSGVGLELVANSESYFRYTTSGSGLLDIRTANFFLGNGANSISGSNGNISISGSAVSINTPNFFLGTQSTFISGSGGNILISGSNVTMLTPRFNFGTTASYISGSDGKVEIYSNRFIVTKTGIVTASGIFVPKGLDNGSTITIAPMIEPVKVYVDATNIGRVVSECDTTEYSFTRKAGDIATDDPIKTVVFHNLINENTLLFTYHGKIIYTGSSGQVGITGLLATLYVDTGSQYRNTVSPPPINYSRTYNDYDSWVLVGQISLEGKSAVQLSGANNATGSWSYVSRGNYLSTYTIPDQYQQTGSMFKLDFFHRIGNSITLNATASIYTKYLGVMTGRDIASNFNQDAIISPSYDSIGAAPVGSEFL